MYCNNAKIFWTNYPQLADAESTDDVSLEAVLRKTPELIRGHFPECDLDACVDDEDEENFFNSTVSWQISGIKTELPELLRCISKLAAAFPYASFRMDLEGSSGEKEHIFASDGILR